MTDIGGRTRLIFLGGLGRSGSTLVERLLSDLPGVTALGEVTHLWERGLRDDELCGCGTTFSRCPFWTQVGVEAFGGWDRLDVEEVLALKSRVDRTRYLVRLAMPTLAPRVRADLRRYLDLYERVYSAAATVAGTAVVVDSSKHVSLAYCLRWSRTLDLRVLHVVRDSPAVAYSWTKQVSRPEVARRPEKASENTFMPRYGAGRVIARWNVDNAFFALLARRGVRLQVLRYEDLVALPERTLGAAKRFAGLPAEARGSLRGQRVHLTTDHTVAGNPMRFTTGELVLQPDNAWRARYPRRRQMLVKAMTLPLRRHLGYTALSPDRGSSHPKGHS